MDIINDQIQHYCDSHTSAESDVLASLNRHTHANILQPRMLSGHFQGRLLSMISKMIAPTWILEIGTYTGYSAICLAEGLTPNGKLITIDVNPEREELINEVIQQAGFQDKVQHIVGDAINIIKTLPQNFDLVFIDADKPNYIRYYELALQRLNPNGIILIDNVLWSGKIIDPSALASDKDTQVLHQLNQLIQADERVENILLPIRDGLMLLRKK